MEVTELVPESGWASARKQRIAPPSPGEQSRVFRALSVVSARFGRAKVPEIFTVFGKNPRIFWAWLFFASRLMPYGKLPGAVREKIILRTAWNCRSRYEWGQHVELGLKAGVRDAEILAITRGPGAFADPCERAVMQACDEVLANKCIADDTWETLRTHYNEKLLIEIVILIGHYEMLAGFLNSAGLSLEPDMERELKAFHTRIAAQPR